MGIKALEAKSIEASRALNAVSPSQWTRELVLAASRAYGAWHNAVVKREIRAHGGKMLNFK